MVGSSLLLQDSQHKKQVDHRIIWKTFGNLIWDYKYIWATLAIGIWLLNLEVYLKGPHNIFGFINSKNRDMVVGIIGGIAAVMLLGKQAKFFKYLPKFPKSRTDCYPNCNPPVDIHSDAVKSKMPKKRFGSIILLKNSIKNKIIC